MEAVEFKEVYLLIHMNEDGHGQTIEFACEAECYSDFEKKLIKYYANEKIVDDTLLYHIESRFIEDKEEVYVEWEPRAFLAEFGIGKVLDDCAFWSVEIWKPGSWVYLE
jgi:hypothetical protein